MKKSSIGLFVLLLFASCSGANAQWAKHVAPDYRDVIEARFPRGSYTSGVGKAQLNLGGGDIAAANFINVLQTYSYSFGSPTDVTRLDASGIPTSQPTSGINLTDSYVNSVWSGVQYKVLNTGTRRFAFFVNGNVSSCTPNGSASVLSGCGGFSATFQIDSGGSVTFTNASTSLGVGFPSTGTYAAGTGNVVLYRVSDELAYQAGEITTPEFNAVVTALKPRAIRPMGFVQAGPANLNSETQWAYRSTMNTVTWLQRYPPGAIVGGGSAAISGTNTYTASVTTDNPSGAYVQGEVAIGIFANTNSVTNPTLALGARGAKPVLNQYGAALGIGELSAGQISTCTYDSIIGSGSWLCRAGAIAASVPIEAQVKIANKLNTYLWAVLPPMVDDTYATNWATAVRDNLNANLLFTPEYSNEIWNTNFPQTIWAFLRGSAFGWGVSGNEAIHSWYGLRVRQVMGNIIPTVFSGQMARVSRILSYQAGGDNTIMTYRFLGSSLNPASNSALCFYLGGTFSGSCSGAPNYSAKPNRPVDVSEGSASAPYAQGENMCNTPDNSCTLTSDNAAFHQSLVTAWEAGQTTTALNLIDGDIRSGRTKIQNVTASGTTFTTPLAHGFTANISNIHVQVTGGTIYSGVTAKVLYRVTSTPTSTTFTMQPFVGGFPSGSNVNAGSAGSGTMTVGVNDFKTLVGLSSTWYRFAEANAAAFDSDRPSGMPALQSVQYEGAPEVVPLTAGQCTSLGVTGVDCAGSEAAAVLAYKNNTLASSFFQDYWKGFMGTDAAMAATFGLQAHSVAPAHLVLLCGGVYGLISTCYPNGAQYQFYTGFQAFSTNWLLKRDLDPASNDNSPMWLEKAA